MAGLFDQEYLAMWGACLSSVLFVVKLWEMFWKDRLRLDTTYCFNGTSDTADEITIVNLSPLPVHVSHWSLIWKPNILRWRIAEIDVTPDDGGGIFAIAPQSLYTLKFSGQDKFDWSHRTATHRQLYLTLHIFGRRRAKVLNVGAGL